ncbi:MAG TPA: lytic transglycosylase domain-containing protein [Thermodesulfobacteriota bacterium]|nr:lytic transglycosylase domain-containing protein [Thermodesulfobacteriota bacterium]
MNMSKKALGQWVSVAFLLPSLLGGDMAKKGAEEGWLAWFGDEFPEQNEPQALEEGPLPGWLSAITESIAREYGVSPRLVKFIIWTESQGNPRKVSAKGAKGLMQLMPVVVQRYKVPDPYDPVANIRGGVQYLSNLLEDFCGDIPLALAAYNAGPTAVRKYGGIPPFAETQAFVKKVSELFHFVETSPPISLAAPGTGEKKFVDQENPPQRMTYSGSPGLLTFLLRRMNLEGVEVQIQ